jgi:hypothetical protein
LLHPSRAGTSISSSRRTADGESDQTPLDKGRREQYGANVSGGSDAVQYFVSGEWEGERNVLKMPDAEAERVLTESGRTELREDEIYPNKLSKWSIRANTNFVISPKATGSVNMGYVSSSTRFPQNDNNILGILSSALNGDGRGETQPAIAWGFFRPGETFQRLTAGGEPAHRRRPELHVYVVDCAGHLVSIGPSRPTSTSASTRARLAPTGRGLRRGQFNWSLSADAGATANLISAG